MKIIKFIKELNKPYKVKVSPVHISELVSGKTEDVYVTTTNLEELKECALDLAGDIKDLIITCVMYSPIVAIYLMMSLVVYILLKLAFMI